MIKLHPYQLHTELNKKTYNLYLLHGDDVFLLKESFNTIKKFAIKHGFNKYYNIWLDINTDWQAIFDLFQGIHLFESRKIIRLFLPENELNLFISENLTKLINLLNIDILLVISGKNFNKIKIDNEFLTLNLKALTVLCQIPTKEDWIFYINKYTKKYNLKIDDDVNKLLFYYYEGNLLALIQTLEKFSLSWPGKNITLNRIKSILFDSAKFKIANWIDAILIGDKDQSIRTLQRLRSEGVEQIVLLRSLQRELLLLNNLQKRSISISLHDLFNKYRIWYNRRVILIKALYRISKLQLLEAIQMLVDIDLSINKDCNQIIWNKLEDISIYLCYYPIE